MFQVLIGDLLIGVVDSEEDADAMIQSWVDARVNEEEEQAKNAFLARMTGQIASWNAQRKVVRL